MADNKSEGGPLMATVDLVSSSINGLTNNLVGIIGEVPTAALNQVNSLLGGLTGAMDMLFAWMPK